MEDESTEIFILEDEKKRVSSGFTERKSQQEIKGCRARNLRKVQGTEVPSLSEGGRERVELEVREFVVSLYREQLKPQIIAPKPIQQGNHPK